MIALLLLACAQDPSPADGPGLSTPPPNRPNHPQGPPQGPPPPGGGVGPGASGAMLQDPSGFPTFHDWPSPTGPRIEGLGDWSAPVKLSEPPGGGYRPQVAVGQDGTIHAVFYTRLDAGDLIRHRTSTDGQHWSEARHLGHDELRNWGPDLVVRADGSAVVVFDHAKADFSSRGYLTFFKDGVWSPPEALTPADGGEIGSGHVADGKGDDLAYVFIGKALDPTAHFVAQGKWFHDGAWTALTAFSDGSADAWHTNVERRPDGSVLVGYDIGTGGSETTLYVLEGRNGTWGTPENLTATGEPGERPHFAFGAAKGAEPGPDHVTWFHKLGGKPVKVLVRSGEPGAWGPVYEPSKGYGGFHFDPEIAINSAGVRCLVWGWDSGGDAELVYSLDTGEGWSKPLKVAEIDWGKPGLASLVSGPDDAFYVVWNQGVRGSNEVYFARLNAPGS